MNQKRLNKTQRKQQCPLCEEVVRFTEIRTRTDIDTTEGKKLVHVVVLRCPECKRIVGPEIPIKNQDEEP